MWRFSDGTEVDPGGVVRGAGLFAQRLRAELALPKTLVRLHPPPTAPTELERRDTGQLDLWLSQMLGEEVRVHGNAVHRTQRHSPLTDLSEPPLDEVDAADQDDPLVVN